MVNPCAQPQLHLLDQAADIDATDRPKIRHLNGVQSERNAAQRQIGMPGGRPLVSEGWAKVGWKKLYSSDAFGDWHFVEGPAPQHLVF